MKDEKTMMLSPMGTLLMILRALMNLGYVSCLSESVLSEL